jgi:conjugal transfer pilus assembly protein TraD
MPLVTTTVESLYRPAHELKASVAWVASAVGSMIAAAATPGMPLGVGVGLCAASLSMAVFRANQAWTLFEAKAQLAGNSFWIAPTTYVDAQIRAVKGQLWLGLGFRWTSKHTQRALEIQKHDLGELLPPAWALKRMGKQFDFNSVKGEPWIHGLEMNEQPITLPWDHVEGNWSFFGTTGAGKTRLYELLAYQVVKKGDVLIVFDPKFDKDLRETLIKTCKAAGRPNAFCEFHPAFPSRSVRIDPTKNFSKATEIPSRVADILGGEAGDNFVAFCWRVMHGVTGGLLYVDERPSLKKLRFYIESGPEQLVERCLKKFFQSWSPGGWENDVQALEEKISGAKGKFQPRMKTGTTRQQAMVQLYHDAVPNEAKIEDVNGLLNIAEHARDHYGKMIAGLLPLLTQLTAAPLDELLSPNYDDFDDPREIVDMEKIIRDKRVLYIATDSLADATVGSAIAAILLSDLRAVAGARYNYGIDDNTKIHILCDEACELVTAPLIAIMNKGRGAGMISYLATQNFSDYISKFGSEDKARMVVGNGNNRLTLRVVDTKTQQYMADSFGETTIVRTSAGVGSSTRSEEPGLEFGGNMTSSVSEQAAELFPGYLLGRLPDLHYIAALSGGKLYKGRLPKISHPKYA